MARRDGHARVLAARTAAMCSETGQDEAEEEAWRTREFDHVMSHNPARSSGLAAACVPLPLVVSPKREPVDSTKHPRRTSFATHHHIFPPQYPLTGTELLPFEIVTPSFSHR